MNRYILFTIILLGLGLSSCEDYLNLSDPDSITQSTFYSTQQQIEQAVTGTYAAMINSDSQDGFDAELYMLFSEVRSDNYDPAVSSNNDWYSIGRFTESTTTSAFASAWENLYQMICYANNIVNSIDDVSFSDDDLKDQYLGEAKFLRAYAYFQLIKIFGEVPLTTSALTISEAKSLGLSERDDLYNQVQEDLIDAKSLLPKEYDDDDLGRATRWAAYSLLGRVDLYRAGYPLEETQYLDSAKVNFKEVIDQEDTYITWCDDYADLFTMDNENKYNIFEIQFASGSSCGSILPDYIQPSYGETDSRYNANGGAFISANACPVSDTLMNSYESADLRFAATIDTVYINDTETESHSNFYVKFRVEGVSIEDHYDWPINFPIIRYADVLLMYAEVLNEINSGPTTDAIDCLNRIRSRAGLDTFVASDFSGKDAFLDTLKVERRHEFAGEGLRWYDLVRWNDAADVMNEFFDDLDYDVDEVTTDDYVYPIPYAETSTVNDGTYDE